MIVEVGGSFQRNLKTVVFGPNSMFLPPLPKRSGPQMKFLAINHQSQVIAGGGSGRECWILQNRKWVHHSFLNSKKTRIYPTAVSMSDGIYLFGSLSTLGTVKLKSNEEPICEFLPNDSNVWEEGPQIPFR